MSYLKRIIGIETRRVVLPAALLVAVPMVGLMAASHTEFDGRWLQLAILPRTMLVLGLALAVGGGTWLGMREHRHHLGELLATTPRPRSSRVRPRAIALAGLLAVAYLLTVPVGALFVLGRTDYFPAAVLPVTAVGALSLVCAGWVGLAVGRAVPWLIMAPLLGLLTAGFAGIAPQFLQDSAGMSGGSSPAALWLTPIWTMTVGDVATVTGRTSLLQAIALAGLAVTGLLLASVGRRLVLPALGPAVAGMAVAVLMLPATAEAAVVADPAAIEQRCTSTGPEVCVIRVHSYQLDALGAPVQRVLTGLAAIGATPTRAEESTEADEFGTFVVPTKGRADTLFFPDAYDTYVSHGSFSPQALQQSLAEQALTPPCDTDTMKGDTYLARLVVGAWLAGSPSMLDPDPGEDFGSRGIIKWSAGDIATVDAGIRALHALPEAQQTAMVSRAWTMLQTCRPHAWGPILALGKA